MRWQCKAAFRLNCSSSFSRCLVPFWGPYSLVESEKGGLLQRVDLCFPRRERREEKTFHPPVYILHACYALSLLFLSLALSPPDDAILASKFMRGKWAEVSLLGQGRESETINEDRGKNSTKRKGLTKRGTGRSLM